MKIILVSQEYPPETGHGGIATQAALKARGLRRLGHDVVVVTHSIDNCRHEMIVGGIRVIRLPGPDHRMDIRTDAARWLGWSTEVAIAVDQLVDEVDPDLVEFAEWGAEGYFFLLNRTARRPVVVVHLHGSMNMLASGLGWPESDSDFYRVGTFMEAMCIHLADDVYASSSFSADWCEAEVGRKPTVVLNSGIDLEDLQPTPPRSRPFNITFIGKVSPGKGVDALVEAACRIAPRHEGLTVSLWGPCDPRFRQQLSDLVGRMGCADMLNFHGAVDRTALGSVLALADVFASPSPFEAGPGIVYLEAMACGVPVIGCSGSGSEDTIRSSQAGLVVPPRDVDALASALETLFDDPQLRSEMAFRGRAYVESVADTRVCVDRIARYFESVLAGSGAS